MLDLTKELEIEKDGKTVGVKYLHHQHEIDKAIALMSKDMHCKWLANEETGECLSGLMPTVRNKKRKPKDGEFWMVKYMDGMVGVAMYREGGEKVDVLEPLYPMIKDPAYKD